MRAAHLSFSRSERSTLIHYRTVSTIRGLQVVRAATNVFDAEVFELTPMDVLGHETWSEYTPTSEEVMMWGEYEATWSGM